MTELLSEQASLSQMMDNVIVEHIHEVHIVNVNNKFNNEDFGSTLNEEEISTETVLLPEPGIEEYQVALQSLQEQYGQDVNIVEAQQFYYESGQLNGKSFIPTNSKELYNVDYDKITSELGTIHNSYNTPIQITDPIDNDTQLLDEVICNENLNVVEEEVYADAKSVYIRSDSGNNIQCKLESTSDDGDIDGFEEFQKNALLIKNELQCQTTPAESMAAEALRQLGGMFGNSEKQENRNNNTQIIVEEEYSCSTCSAMFRKKTDLQNHLNSHQTQRPYRCQTCNASFQRPSSLTNHMKIHNYQPGRALVAAANKFLNNQIPDFPASINSQQWQPNQKLDSNVSDQSLFNSTEPITSWNFDFSGSDDISQSENLPITQEITASSTFQEETDFDCYNPNVDSQVIMSSQNNQFNYQTAVKVEELPFIGDLKSNPTIVESFAATNLQEIQTSVCIDEKRTYICTKCGKGFSRAKALANHQNFHNEIYNNQLECQNCDDVFIDIESVTAHKRVCVGKVNDDNITSQNIQAPHTQRLPSLLNSHVKSITDPDFTLNLEQSSNTSTTQVDKPQTAANQNAKPSAKVGKHACMECGKRFATKQKMFRHMWIHRKKTFTCEICAMTFTLQQELDEHRLAQHPGDTPYVCQECGKCFASRQGLWEHGRVHGSGTAGLFRCKVCEKNFASRQGYLIHTRVHTGERPYGCRYCWKAFRDGGTLRKHERIHTGERPHACPLCPRAFNQKVVLREHVRWVHAANTRLNDIDMYPCSVCGQTVSDREELCAHIVKHSDQIAAIAKENASKQGNALATTVENDVQLPKVTGIKKQKKKSKVNLVVSVMKNNIKETAVQFIQSTNIEQMNDTGDFVSEEFTCDMCENIFTSRDDLLTHVRIHI